MLFIITILFFLLWTIWVIHKGPLSGHTVIGIYVTTLFIVDFGDVSFDHFLNLYDLPTRLLNNNQYLAIVFSDGIVFPLIAIIFCSYSVRYNRPWLLSFLFAAMVGIIEIFYEKFDYMIYHHWNSWLTPVITFILFRVLAHFARQFVYYSPPVSYQFCLMCFVYTISEWPGALLAGVMHLYQYRPYIFADSISDDRFIAMLLATAMGVLAAYFAPKSRQEDKLFLFLSVGFVSVLFALWMYGKGRLIYHNWNHLFTVIRYITPYLIIYLYDRWETNYRDKKLVQLTTVKK